MTSTQHIHIVVSYIYDPYFTESHVISYNSRLRLYTVETTEVLRRNNADIHKEYTSNQFVYTDKASLIHTLCKYLPPVYAIDTEDLMDVCETDEIYINRGAFKIQYNERYLHKWYGYIQNNGVCEDSIQFYLSSVQRSDIYSILEIWLTTLCEKQIE
jgi:hypothetical protein